MTGGEEKYYIEEDESLDAIGAAFAAEIASFDTSRLFRLTKASLDRLTDYYIEVGLMSSDGGNPFTDAAARFARRHRINGGLGAKFTLVKGEITRVTARLRQSDLDDEIPF